MQNSELGNIISRLQGLKNVNPRKVMPGEGILQENNPPPPNVEGTASQLPDFSAFLPPGQNQPESDLGGELTPQSYDVRANAVTTPEEPVAEESYWTKLGRSLSKAWQELPDFKYQPEAQAQEPPLPEEGYMTKLGNSLSKAWNELPDLLTPEQKAAKAAQERPFTAIKEQHLANQERAKNPEAVQQYLTSPIPESTPGIVGFITDLLSPTKKGQWEDYNADLVKDAQALAEGKDPQQVRAEEHQKNQELVQRAIDNPGEYAIEGLADKVENHPALKAEFQNVVGIDYTPEVAAQVSAAESAMKGIEDSLSGINTQLDEQEESLRQRILKNQATDADKYLIGLALVMPLIIGGIFGKEAGLGALGGGAKGFADVLTGRQKGIREDESSLLDIAKQQSVNQEKLGNLALEKAQLEPNIRKSLPKDVNEHLIGMKEVNWLDPETGEEKTAYRIKPGLVADAEFVASKEGKADMLKAANQLSATKTYVQDVNEITNNVLEIAKQLKDKNILSKMFVSVLTKADPTTLPKISQDVMYKGKMVNAGLALQEELGFLANKYGMAQELGQLDRAAQAHIGKIMNNPTSSFISPSDTIAQMKQVRDLAQRGLINQATNDGFIPEFLIKEMQESNKKFSEDMNEIDKKKRETEITNKLLKG